jgi:glycine/serine hydroxymethyltransferase
MKETEIKQIAALIRDTLEKPDSADTLKRTRGVVADLCDSFPIYS